MLLSIVSCSTPKYSAPETKLNLKYHHQEHSLSCEVASLKMVLDYYGLNTSEKEIISRMKFDPTLKTTSVWGDPDEGFVGNIDGEMPKDGYGIHAKGLQELAQNWRPTQLITNGSIQDLVLNIENGKPIIIWGYKGPGTPIPWTTPTGKLIHAIDGEHTWVIYGFAGDSKNPSGFFAMDPVTEPVFLDINYFEKIWKSLDNSAIIL